MKELCRKCAKKFCENRDEIDNCKEFISIVSLAIEELGKNIKKEKRLNND